MYRWEFSFTKRKRTEAILNRALIVRVVTHVMNYSRSRVFYIFVYISPVPYLDSIYNYLTTMKSLLFI